MLFFQVFSIYGYFIFRERFYFSLYSIKRKIAEISPIKKYAAISQGLLPLNISIGSESQNIIIPKDIITPVTERSVNIILSATMKLFHYSQ